MRDVGTGNWDAIAMVWTSYLVDTETSAGRIPGLGHAGILLINRTTGHTEYYEYGRYDSKHLGYVRQVHIPDVQMQRDIGAGLERPNEASLHRVLSYINRICGQNGPMAGAYVHGLDGTSARDWLRHGGSTGQSGFTPTGAHWEWFRHPAGETYSLLTNNCITFVQDALEAGGIDTPWLVDPTPSSYIDELRDKFDDVNLSPRPDGGTDLSIVPETSSWFDFFYDMSSQLNAAESPEQLAQLIELHVELPPALEYEDDMLATSGDTLPTNSTAMDLASAELGGDYSFSSDDTSSNDSDVYSSNTFDADTDDDVFD